MSYIQKEFDLHGHSKYSAFDELVNYSPKDAMLRALDVGLDGIAITGHDTLEGTDEALNTAERLGIIFVPGIELTSQINNRTPHILVLGISPERAFAKSDILPVRKKPQQIIDWAHEKNGVVIVPHPSKTPRQRSLGYSEIIKLGKKLDGIETITYGGRSMLFEKLAKQLSIAMLGSSDFHALNRVGVVRTVIDNRIIIYQDVIEAIRKNLTKPIDTRD